MPICIIGMHRSGTSMVARLLNLCGLDLGPPDELLGPHESNPLGHFENQGFLKINDALLAHFGGSWDNPPQLKEGWESDPSLEALVREARSLINNLSRSPRWGWKDPRTTILLPFWKGLLPDLRFVICVRSPLEVAKSLARRDRIPIEKGIYIWNQYIRSAIRDTEGCPRTFSFYEDFFENAPAEIGRLAKFCGLKTPDDPSNLYQTISRDLKHHTSETAELLNDVKVVTEYKLFYIGLRALSIQGFASSMQGGSREQLISENIGQFLNLIEKFHDEHEAAKLQEALAQKDVQLAQLQSMVQSQEEALGEKEQQVAQLQATVHSQQQVLMQRDELIRQMALEKERLNLALQVVNRSIGWWLITRYYAIKGKVMPAGTRRRVIYDLFLKSLKTIIFEGWSSFFHKAKNKFKSLRKPHFKVPSALVGPLFFHQVEDPKVSIIIPVFNKAEYTYQCLKSLLEYTPKDLCEVIVIDNASTDETNKMLNKTKNIKVLTNSENLGFIGACNQGSAAARGTYLLFLNNDTVVTAGWLDAMLTIFEKFAKVGAVGSKLLYPDGKLQEAGGIIWKDGTGWNYGRGDDPSKPEYNYVKEVDYLSGACLLVKKELFEKVGRFDERFKPCYADDSDLAFSLRSHGYKVIYQPKSEVFHFEGVTAGTDITKGFKKYQEINRHKFAEKWKIVLESDQFLPPKNSTDNTPFIARERGYTKRILFIDHYVPEYDKDAGSLRMYEYLKIFVRLGYKIVFWPDNLNRSTPYTEELQQMGIEVIYGNNDFDEYMKRFGKYFELAYLCRATVAIKYIDVIKKYKNIKIIYDTHDLCFLRELRRAELEKRQELLGSAMNLKSIELYLASLSDTVVVVSQIEQDILLQENSRLNVKLLPAVYRVQSNRSEFDKRNGLLFIGGFAHIPNVDGIIWFTHKIFPKIVMGQPDIKLYIVGSNPPEEVLKLSSENVVVTGYVRDVEPFFLNSRVFIAPLRYGAGIKGKILQSMSYGLPVVTTSIGAEGMPLTNTEKLLIADDETDFAEKVTGLYFDRALWQELSQNSTEYMAANFTPEVCEIKFRELLDFK